MWNILLTTWVLKTILLCLLSLFAIFAMGIAAGLTVKGVWKLLTSGATKEFLTPEGRFCFLIGGLFGILIFLFAFTPDIVAYIAHMIDPKSFNPPKEASLIIFFLLFLYFIINVLFVGVLYKNK